MTSFPKIMYILIGVSGSGKTRWSSEKTAELADQGIQVCYHSMAKCKRYFVLDKMGIKEPSINEITKIVANNREDFDKFYQERIRKDFNRSTVVIVDGTNLVRHQREPYIQAADEFGFRKIYVIVNTNHETLIKRQALRRSPIPLQVLDRQLKDWKLLNEDTSVLYSEYDECIRIESQGV